MPKNWQNVSVAVSWSNIGCLIVNISAKFHKKILFITPVINIQILTTKYFGFQYSVTYCSQTLRRPTHRARETVHNSWNTRLHHSSSVGSQQSWPQPSRLPDLGEAAGACVPQPDSWRRPAEVVPDRRVGTFPPGGHRWSGQAVASTSSSLRSSTRWTFWTQTLGVLASCNSHWRTLDSQSRLLPIVDTYVFEWPY